MSENQKSEQDVIVGGERYLLITPITLQTCHAKPKNSNQQAPDATSFFPLVWMPPMRTAWPALSESQDAGIAAD